MRNRTYAMIAGISTILVLQSYAYAQSAKNSIIPPTVALYNKQCAVCHGKEGKGDGEAAYLLMPRPRDFTSGKFRLTTTDNGVPSNQDLFNTITRGMPGSAMPAWKHLPEKDRWNLARYVRKLARRSASEYVNLEPGKPRKLPPFLSAAQAEKLLKKENMTAATLYQDSCASCHGKTGKGDGTADMKDEQGYRLPPRDFTKGILKGKGDMASLAHRLYGMQGSAMPDAGFEQDAHYIWGVIHYIRGMMPKDDAIQEQVHYKRTIRAGMSRTLPTDPLDPAWKTVQPTYIPLMQLWQQNAAMIPGVYVRALHDTTRVVFHISWSDASKNDTLSGVQSFGDAAAVQFSKSRDLPFFAMGDSEHPVTIWMWKAGKQNAREITLLPSQHLTATDAGNIVSSASSAHPTEHLTANGFGTLETRETGMQTIQGKGIYQNGTWSVVLYRSRTGLDTKDIMFKPDATLRIGFAVWDGEERDRNGKKSVTVWHDLILK